MKFTRVLFLILLLSFSCVTIKKAPEIEDYKVLDGRQFQKRNFTDRTAFVFQNDLKMVDFRGFLADKYELSSFKSTARIPVEIDNISFELFVFTPEIKQQKINFIGAIINKNPEDVTIDEETYDYVGISVSREDDLDCLSENSIYHNLVRRYLENLKDEYFRL
ncbi:hypothetical protein ACJD0Z_00160 [Flavobacteriaceae bacterium M23B6Z8]